MLCCSFITFEVIRLLLFIFNKKAFNNAGNWEENCKEKDLLTKKGITFIFWHNARRVDRVGE